MAQVSKVRAVRTTIFEQTSAAAKCSRVRGRRRGNSPVERQTSCPENPTLARRGVRKTSPSSHRLRNLWTPAPCLKNPTTVATQDRPWPTEFGSQARKRRRRDQESPNRTRPRRRRSHEWGAVQLGAAQCRLRCLAMQPDGLRRDASKVSALGRQPVDGRKRECGVRNDCG